MGFFWARVIVTPGLYYSSGDYGSTGVAVSLGAAAHGRKLTDSFRSPGFGKL